MTTNREKTGDTLIDVVPLSETTWRVCDTRCDEGDSRHIVGYIHSIAGGYEVMWMRPRPGVTYRYATFEDAVRETSRRMRLVRRPG
ncbi:hypothetical protein ACFPER_00210 [Agromyces aurantiacus]|uniref:KTSC domain-containing protein n=1 Tax=Agromyces aurantiacus TaxID=165814 RepID=A0ABV9R4F0_9MICO|nr:hypothetical protein [Agromyces aurantiacus]MBM7505505.1 hypothetical protein [Agromyces aurantiacus]